MLTGRLGSTPSVLGLFCLAYVPLTSITPVTPIGGGGRIIIRRKKKPGDKKLEEEEKYPLPKGLIVTLMTTLLSD